ncbi:MAG TPA: M28 family peptidase, partial [Chthoniobacterales bacterium]|nr:M28 family peptidase [Chthoniobacterales bacterium]
ALTNCDRSSAQVSGNAQKPASNQIQNGAPSESPTPAVRADLWTQFDANEALAEAKTLANFGPRPSGSDANKQIRKHIADRLSALAWQTTEQKFAEHAPDGQEIEFCNLSARFTRYQPSTKRILIGAHFDTPPASEYRDSGASDGAANSATLIEIARVLATDPKLAGNVELLFIDGDAPFRELNLADGLFGSRFYAQTLRVGGHAGDITAAIILENAGGPTLNYLPNSTQTVVDALKQGAKALGTNIVPANRFLLADHVPFLQAGIPSATLLDADSPFLRTADDTADRLNADSLAKAGGLILYYISSNAATR